MLTVREQASCQLRDVVVSLRHSRTFVGPLLSGEGCRDEIKVPLGPTHMNLRKHTGWDSIPSFCYQGMRFHVLSPAFVAWMLGFGIWGFGCKQRARFTLHRRRPSLPQAPQSRSRTRPRDPTRSLPA